MTEPLDGRNLIHASGILTRGAFEVFETWGDAGDGPPLHFHAERDEAFYVLEGIFGFWRDNEVIEVEPGEFVFVPRGSHHRFEARIDHSRMLLIVAPAGLEGYFREMSKLVAAGREPLDVRLELSERYDSRIVTSLRVKNTDNFR